jgi:hypothetical protein
VDDYSTGPSQSTTLESCTDTCTDLGYGFIGLTGNTQDGASCYCGNTPNPQAVKAPSSQCNLPCPGNSSEICGGDYRMSLYNTTCNGPFIGPGAACSQPAAQAFPFCNTSLTRAERVSDLVSRISLAEAGAMLTARSSPALVCSRSWLRPRHGKLSSMQDHIHIPSILSCMQPRLGVPSFYWGTNVVHGASCTIKVCWPLSTKLCMLPNDHRDHQRALWWSYVCQYDRTVRKRGLGDYVTVSSDFVFLSVPPLASVNCRLQLRYDLAGRTCHGLFVQREHVGRHRPHNWNRDASIK